MSVYNVTMVRSCLAVIALVGLLFSGSLWLASYWEPGYKGAAFTIEGLVGKIHFDNTITNSQTGWKPPEFQGFRTIWRPTIVDADLDSGALHIYIPLWIPTLIFTCAFAFVASPIQRRRVRRKLGLCVKCGYDLHGLSESRCPECNTPFEQAQEEMEN